MAAQQQGPDDADPRYSGLEKFTAREPDNYAEAVRQREILKTSTDVGELFVETKQAMEHGEIDEESRRSILRSAVERMIIDVENIIQNTGGRETLLEAGSDEVGYSYEVTLSPPQELYALIQDDRYRVIGKPEIQPKTAAIIQGLWGFLESPEFFNAEWTLQVEQPHGRPQPITRSTTERMPVDASREAYRTLRRFLSDIDLDLGPNLPDYMGDGDPGI